MDNRLKLALALVLAISGTDAVAMAQTPTVADGVWINPRHSVAVRTGPCGARLCGWVVWADGEAVKDAQDSGVAKLIGIELLEDYAQKGSGSWSGTVFVPDMNRHFASQIDALSPSQLRIKGCVLGGLICKSQIWSRIEELPR